MPNSRRTSIDMETSAELSECRLYRYALWRRWSPGNQVLFIMLNPSTADETIDDPTIRRCISFAESWGFGALTVANLFAFRTPSPAELQTADDPIGPENDAWLERLQQESQLTVAAWGNHGRLLNRSATIRPLLHAPRTLGLTQRGEPRHPLYVAGDTEPTLWE